MSTLILSLLLLALVAIGLLMGRRAQIERFAGTTAAAATTVQAATATVSPALANMIAIPAIPLSVPLQPSNGIQRGQDAVAGMSAPAKALLGPGGEMQPAPTPVPATKSDEKPAPAPATAGCPACPVCPDMSQYIKMDEVPCWNCTLP
jgi:hypothetical protein